MLLGSLQKKVVAIYSLTETAARRAGDFITSSAPGTTVELSADRVGTAALRHLARNADIFVVVTGSAKHAATEFIDANRPKNDASRVTLRPKGRGAASILRALFEHLSRLHKDHVRSEV
jgi:hypothetical protein